MAQVVTIADGVATVDFIGQISAGGGGGGISDVQVNGTSVVTNGVANIPAASSSVNGVVTTGTQIFSGAKTFRPDANRTDGFKIEYSESKAVLRPFSSGGGKLGTTSNPFEDINTNNIHVKNIVYAEYYSNYSGAGTIIPASYSGTMMVAGAWSNGTSGSVTLSQSGTYQIYMNDGKNNINFGLVYFDASTDTYAQAPMTSHNEGYLLSIEGSAGDHPKTLHIYQINSVGHTQTEVNYTVYYRRVGI